MLSKMKPLDVTVSSQNINFYIFLGVYALICVLMCDVLQFYEHKKRTEATFWVLCGLNRKGFISRWT